MASRRRARANAESVVKLQPFGSAQASGCEALPIRCGIKWVADTIPSSARRRTVWAAKLPAGRAVAFAINGCIWNWGALGGSASAPVTRACSDLEISARCDIDSDS